MFIHLTTASQPEPHGTLESIEVEDMFLLCRIESQKKESVPSVPCYNVINVHTEEDEEAQCLVMSNPSFRFVGRLLM